MSRLLRLLSNVLDIVKRLGFRREPRVPSINPPPLDRG